MAATEDGGQRLKATLAARDPKTDELHAFPAGTSREDLPSWVQADDGAFDGEPAPAKKATRRRSAKSTGDDGPATGADDAESSDGADEE